MATLVKTRDLFEVKTLPTVKIESKQYFLDFRLMQVRNVANPHEYVTFHSKFDMLDWLSENNVINQAMLEKFISEYVI